MWNFSCFMCMSWCDITWWLKKNLTVLHINVPSALMIGKFRVFHSSKLKYSGLYFTLYNVFFDLPTHKYYVYKITKNRYTHRFTYTCIYKLTNTHSGRRRDNAPLTFAPAQAKLSWLYKYLGCSYFSSEMF